jgi:hypothetical protein
MEYKKIAKLKYLIYSYNLENRYDTPQENLQNLLIKIWNIDDFNESLVYIKDSWSDIYSKIINLLNSEIKNL